jgi:hypothetical protein
MWLIGMNPGGKPPVMFTKPMLVWSLCKAPPKSHISKQKGVR